MGNKGGHVPSMSECVEVQARTKDIPPQRSQSPCQILGQGNFLQGAAFWVSVGGWEGEGRGEESIVSGEISIRL